MSCFHVALQHGAQTDSQPKAMTILEAKAAPDNEWTKLQKLPAWDESKVISKAEVIRRAKLEGNKVHFGNINALVSSQKL